MNPALFIGNIEVVSITPTGIRMVVHDHSKTVADVETLEFKSHIAKVSKKACDYLRDEGFLTGIGKEWKLSVGVMIANKQ